MISKEILEFIQSMPIGKDKNIDIAKGLNKYPTNMSEFINFVKFTFKYKDVK